MFFSIANCAKKSLMSHDQRVAQIIIFISSFPFFFVKLIKLSRNQTLFILHRNIIAKNKKLNFARHALTSKYEIQAMLAKTDLSALE